MALYGHITRKDNMLENKREPSMKMDGYVARGRPNKRWMDCTKSYICEKAVSIGNTSNRKKWKQMTYCTNPK